MSDTFTAESARTPVQIGDIEIVLTDYLDNETQPDSISFSVQIIYDNGDIETRSGNLAPFMTAAQISSVQSFAATMRAKAEAELLP